MNDRTARRAAVVCALFLSSWAAAAAPAKTPAPDYWPMAVGNTWTIDANYNGKTTPQTLLVTKSTPTADHAKEASIDYSIDGKVTQTEVYRIDRKGLYRIHSGRDASGTITPPLPVIRYPVVYGSSWTWKGAFSSGGQTTQASAELTANGPETVITSTGDFKSLRVHLELTIYGDGDAKSLVTNDYWFSPGVGMVKQSFEQGDTKVSGALSSYSLKK